MKLITRDTDYAIRALLHIKESTKDILTASEIALELKMPKPFLRKILQTLQKEGILESTKGNQGGFVLKKSLSDIYLSELIRIFQGEIQLVDCIFRRKICKRQNICPLRHQLIDIENFAKNKLESVTLQSLTK